MKHFSKTAACVSLFFISFCFNACISEEEEDDTGTVELEVGDPIPLFNVTMDDGTSINTNDLKGSISVIFFFHTLCPDCQEEFPVLQNLYEHSPYDIKMIGISRKEETPSIQAYWEEHGLTLPYSAQKDAGIYHLFAKSIVPRVYIIDADLIIQDIYTDNPIATQEELMASIQKCLK